METKSINILLVSDYIGNDEQELALREEATALAHNLTDQGFNPNIHSEIQPFEIIKKGTLLGRISDLFGSSYYISPMRPKIGKGWVQNYIKSLSFENPTIIIGDFSVSYHNKGMNTFLFPLEGFMTDSTNILYLAHWTKENCRDQSVLEWLEKVDS